MLANKTSVARVAGARPTLKVRKYDRNGHGDFPGSGIWGEDAAEAMQTGSASGAQHASVLIAISSAEAISRTPLAVMSARRAAPSAATASGFPARHAREAMAAASRADQDRGDQESGGALAQADARAKQQQRQQRGAAVQHRGREIPSKQLLMIDAGRASISSDTTGTDVNATATRKTPPKRTSHRHAPHQVAAPSRRSVVVRADGGFIGSQTNLIMVTMTGLTLAAGRFGLAPTVKKGTTAGLKLVDRSNAAGVLSNDPSGACGGGAVD